VEAKGGGTHRLLPIPFHSLKERRRRAGKRGRERKKEKTSRFAGRTTRNTLGRGEGEPVPPPLAVFHLLPKRATKEEGQQIRRGKDSAAAFLFSSFSLLKW